MADKKLAFGLPNPPDPMRDLTPEERRYMETEYDDTPLPPNIYQRIGEGLREYFEPTPEVRARDVAREIPGAIRKLFGGAIGGIRDQLGTDKTRFGKATYEAIKPMNKVELKHYKQPLKNRKVEFKNYKKIE